MGRERTHLSITHTQGLIGQGTYLVNRFRISCACYFLGVFGRSRHMQITVSTNPCQLNIFGCGNQAKLFDHICYELHGLLVSSRIQLKIILLTYKALQNLAVQYLTELIQAYTEVFSPSKISGSKTMDSIKSMNKNLTFTFYTPLICFVIVYVLNVQSEW